MTTKRSAETELRHVRKELKTVSSIRIELLREIVHWKDRAVAAEKNLEEWKVRFDELMALYKTAAKDKS
jgi:hypothetical protein